MKYIRQLPTNVKSSDILRVSSELYGKKNYIQSSTLFIFIYELYPRVGRAGVSDMSVEFLIFPHTRGLHCLFSVFIPLSMSFDCNNC